MVYGALLAEQPPAADALQRPLRSRFQARLRRSVRLHSRRAYGSCPLSSTRSAVSAHSS